MSDDDTEYYTPESRTDRIKYSVTTLWDDFGRTDSAQLGLVINTGLALLGVIVYILTSGLVSYAGIAWAILNIYPVFQWVISL